MGAGYLPEGGGTMDQPVKMLTAFSFMSEFEEKLKKSNEPGGIPIGEDGGVDYAEVNRRNMAALGVKC